MNLRLAISRSPMGAVLRGVEYRSPPRIRGLLRNDPIMDALLRLQRERGPQTFMQLGSNDGVTNDPLHRFVLWHRWRGIAVEPVPSIFRQLRRNYRWTRRVRCVNTAVGPKAGMAEFFAVQGRSPDDPFWVDHIGSLDREHLLPHAHAIPNIASRIVTIEVSITTVSDLWREMGEPRVDLLHVDVEGRDAAILEEVPYKAMGITAVLYEHAHMTAGETEAVQSVLDHHGFEATAETRIDRLAVRHATLRPTAGEGRQGTVSLPKLRAKHL